MTAAFEMFFRLIQNGVRQRWPSPHQKVDISDVFWKRFEENIKQKFKQDAKDINTTNGSTGKRKMTPFWFFTVTLMNHLQ